MVRLQWPMAKKLSIVEIIQFTRDSQLRAISEATFKNAVMDMAKENGWHRAHFLPTQVRPGRWITAQEGEVGFPDLILMRRGSVPIAAELKKQAGNTTSPEQDEWLTLFLEAGFLSCVWRPSDAYRIIELLK